MLRIVLLLIGASVFYGLFRMFTGGGESRPADRSERADDVK